MAPSPVPVSDGGDGARAGPAWRGRRVREILRQRAVASLLLLCVLFLVIIWTSIAVGLKVEQDEARDRAMRETANRAQLFEDLVVRTLHSADETLRYLAAGYLEAGRRLDLEQFARVRAAHLEPWSAITVVDENGDVVLSLPGLQSPLNLAHGETFRTQRKGAAAQPLIGAPHSSVLSGKWTMPMSRRITRADGSFAGVVTIGLDPSYFSGFQDRLSLGADSVVTLVGRDGIVRARRASIPATPDDRLGDVPLFDHVKRSPEGSYLSTRTRDGIPRFFSYRALQEYPLIAAVGISEATVMEGYRRAAVQYSAWAAAITIVTLLFAGVALAQARRQAVTGLALRTSEARYRSFISATSRLIWTTDPAGRMLEDAPTWRAYTGQTLAEFKGDGWLQAVLAEDRQHIASGWARAVRTRSMFEVEFRVRGADGVYRPFACKAVPVTGEDGAVREWIGVMEDVTARQQAERARALLAAIVENANDAIISRKLDGTITSWNAAAERLFGYTAQEAIGRHVGIILREGSHGYVEQNSERLRRGEPIPPKEGVRRARDGRLIPVVSNLSRIVDESGAVTGIAVMLRDISERKKAEAGLELAARVYENAAEGLAVTDAGNNIVSVNRAYTEITGYGAEEAVGRNPRILASGQHPPSFSDAIWRSVRRDGRWHGEVWDRRRNGEKYCALLSVTVARDGQGRITQHCWILMDITARKLYEQQLLTLNAELEERVAERTRKLEDANKELGAFSYSVSHDLRAPIRAIQGYSSLLLSQDAGGMTEAALKRLMRIQSNAEGMGQLIDDLLRLSRVSQRQLERGAFNLSALAEDVVRELRRADAGRQVDVTVQRGMIASGDASLVRHVMENLIGNAWKFTAHAARAYIEVGVDSADGRNVYYVKDNGAGFDMQYAHKLFSAFQRLHRREDFDGTGIGLSIVHRVVMKHGGAVWADAEVNRGAAFYFTLA